MKTISATLIYYSSGPYGHVQHTAGKYHFFTEKSLREKVRNADSVLNRRGANHIVLDLPHALAVQVSGYNRRRGAFADVVPLAELQPYLDK